VGERAQERVVASAKMWIALARFAWASSVGKQRVKDDFSGVQKLMQICYLNARLGVYCSKFHE
jgi:hypothetical protein